MAKRISVLRCLFFMFALGICLLSVQGCAIAPVASPEKEQETGAEYAKMVEQVMGLVDDPDLVDYIEAIGRRLAKSSPRQDVTYSFHLVDRPEPNAFALPGGYIFISRGLLALVNSEDELAGAIGHEVAHVAGYHHAKRATAEAATSPLKIITGIAGMATGIVAPGLGKSISDLGDAASDFFLAPYSRDQEREADRLGQEISSKAGYDPNGLSVFLKTLEREDALHRGSPRQYSFFATHPALRERVAKTSQQATKLQSTGGGAIAQGRDELLSKLDWLLIGENPSHGLFIKKRFLHPDLGFTLTFPVDWRAMNSPLAVIGQSPKEDALIFLQMVAKREDPLAFVRKLDKKADGKLLKNAKTTQIGGLPAIRNAVAVRGSGGTLGLDLTWIAHKRRIYQITGICPIGIFKSYGKPFVRTATSFRPLTPIERDNILESRLRIISAQEGETLERLIGRVNGVWTVPETAVANAIGFSRPLKEGQLVKVPIQQAYR